MTGKKVLDAGQQGKYFWMIMSSPPHPVFHFGMIGWFHIRGEPTSHFRPRKTEEEEEVWPPKFWKFSVETDSKPKVEAAFTDARRLARVRLVHCAAADIRKTTPLKENGPDPVIDKDILTEDWLVAKMKKKHVPVKAFMLDQANISGIGNWVGDEILYHAKLHPEQYTDTFSEPEIRHLHASIRYVCQTAVDHLSDSSKFPAEWLFKHRWGKGKKDAATTLPSGEKITFLTVGGRTSCVVPSVQKKTGAVAGEVKKGGEASENGIVKKRGGTRKKKTNSLAEDGDDDKEAKETDLPAKRKRKRTARAKVTEDASYDEEVVTPSGDKLISTAKEEGVKTEAEVVEPSTRKRAKKANTGPPSAPPRVPETASRKVKVEDQPREGRRRSARVTRGNA